MSLCVLAGAKTTVLALSAFTLSWTHSVEKIEWQEDWRVTPAGLEIVEARVKGSGAGMEPPEDAVLRDGWWHYRPVIGPLPELVLARSDAAGNWTIDGEDLEPRRLAEPDGGGKPLILKACK
jgi:hypothetical protein